MRIPFRIILLPFLVFMTSFISRVSSANVMSIDLGTEWMKVSSPPNGFHLIVSHQLVPLQVGIVSPGQPMEMALNKESKRKTPSVIAFRDESRSYGEEAVSLAARFPASSYGYLLDLLGKDINNPIVELYKKRFPYYNIEADSERNTVTFKNGDEIYTVEELVSQLLTRAQEFAQDATGQPIQECVLIVPGFFGQSERLALLSAARLANLKVLQLMNDYTAVGLNYGIFQRKNFNETAQYFMFYDMGASKTTASIVSYQLVKDKVLRETLPVVQVIGVGYDRTLGGMEMQLRLRDHLADAFNNMKKTTKNVYENPRALAKLFKEAGRVKNVLSANNDHYAQIEGLLDEQDFKFMVTRTKFEELCADLFERVAAPVKKAIESAGITLDVINQVILFGGATRTPKIQEILKKTIKMELGKNLNADEAATMGAAYRAADLATGFKVKKFIVKDAVLFPIQVIFDREGGGKKPVVRTLFGPMNVYPQKKVITFNKHKQNFDFFVNYADLDYLSADEVANIGSLNISRVQLTNVGKLMEEKLQDGIESKGIKAHFYLDDSGIFSLLNVELLLEKSADEAEEEKEGTLSKLGSTISKLFSGDKEDNKVESAPANETEPEPEADADSTEAPPTPVNSTDFPTNETVSEPAQNETTTEKEKEKPKVVTIKELVESTSELLLLKQLDGDKYQESKSRIEVFSKFEREKLRRESAVNALESHVIETQRRLDQDEYASCATEKELEDLRAMCSTISEWLYEDGIDAEVRLFEQKLDHLTKKTDQVYERHWEHNERPEALKALLSMINGSEHFLASAKNISTDPEKKDVFTEKEILDLEKAIKETVEWRDKEVAAQNKLAKNVQVRLTVKIITEKMSYLDREVKYLVNKIKAWRPKEKPKKKKKATNETVSETAEPTDENQQEVPPEKTEDAEAVVEEIPIGEGAVEEPTLEQTIDPTTTETTTEEVKEQEHTEL